MTPVGSSSSEPLFQGLNFLFRASNGVPLDDQPLRKIAFGKWGVTDAEDLVVCHLTPNVLEIHCHGGEAAVRRVLSDLSMAGCTVIDGHAQQTLQNGLLDAECLDVLSRTSTVRTTKIVLEQTHDLLKSAFRQLLSLDSDGDDSLFDCLDRLLEWADFGQHLSMPWNVVLTGRPNVGKSSLINSLLGYQRAIVFDQPGTTRDIVTGETAFDGWPVILADTAGLRDNAGELEAAGIALARERLQSADLRLVLVDISQFPTQEDLRLIVEWSDAIVVAHKVDLENRWRNHLPQDAICVSSVTGEGLIELQQRIVSRLVPRVPELGVPVPLTLRQVDKLREIRSAKAGADRRNAIEALIGMESD